MSSSKSHQESKSHASNGQIQKKPFFTKSQSGIQQKHETPFFQAKLNVGQPNDKYEKEADLVANTVINKKSETPVIQQKQISNIPQLQTKCTDCEKKKEEKGPIQTKSETGGGTASPQLSSKIQSSSGSGNALPKNTLTDMNNSFSADFSHVRIHNDSEAVSMNKELQAQAFTYGNDIYFNSGKYNPESSSGKHLLAHELTHVVQQNNSIHRQDDGTHEAETTFVGPNEAQDVEPLDNSLSGAPNACLVNAAFPFSRSGILRSALGSVGERFEVRVEWSSAILRGESSYCAAECGEYHQFVKGHMLSSSEKDGSNLTDISANIFGGRRLDKNVFQEDGLDKNPNARYGHRKESQTMDEEYKPNRMTGTQYFGRDFPNVSIGTFADIDLTFVGKLVDTCNKTESLSEPWRVQYRGIIRP